MLHAPGPDRGAADPTDFSDMQDWFRKALFVLRQPMPPIFRDEIGAATDCHFSLDILLVLD